ncbi:MAG: serine/threonine protein kinase [Myxococcales bacterium]|nr:serine/threonine protein kinase [Myxococcales bacterium]
MIEIGQSVGNYQVTAKLGEGGMGVVFLAEHPVIGRKAALKAIHPQHARSAEVISRFITEAKSVNQIGHEHIVDITDFGTTPTGDFYFIMEYLQGEALSDLIRKGPRFSPERALRIAVQIADALQASHDSGVIHRDLKPDNVFLVTRGEDADFVKVLDFGLAKLIDPEAAPGHNTQTGAVMGTAFYMSPEQCEGKAPVDHRADVYALGVLLFEMLTGKLPFGGTGYGEVILKHMTMRPPAARSIVPELAPVLDAILFRALAKKPAERFQTMAELRAALLDPEAFAGVLPELDVQEDFSGRLRAANPMARSEMRSRPALSAQNVSHGPGTSAGRSTFRESAGQLEDVPTESIPRTRVGRWLGTAALVGVAALVLSRVGYQRPAARVVAAAQALSRPATVRLNFGSDPDGATVSRTDGTILGVTPLSVEVPYGDAATEYSFQKEGFVPKTLSIVPNLPAPLFVTLVGQPVPDPSGAPAAARTPTPAGVRRPASRPSAHRPLRATPRDDGAGEDEPLPPSQP